MHNKLILPLPWGHALTMVKSIMNMSLVIDALLIRAPSPVQSPVQYF